MTDPQFVKALDNEVSALAKKYNLPESKAFLIWFGKLAFDLDDEGFESVVVDGPNDKSIDLFWVDDFANRVIVAQGTYSKSADRKLKDNAVEALLGSLDWLNQPASDRGLRKESGPTARCPEAAARTLPSYFR
jgi:hypothetical protein